MAAGILTGIAALAAFALSGTTVVGGINVGIVALGLNLVMTVVVGYVPGLLRLGGDRADSPSR